MLHWLATTGQSVWIWVGGVLVAALVLVIVAVIYVASSQPITNVTLISFFNQLKNEPGANANSLGQCPQALTDMCSIWVGPTACKYEVSMCDILVTGRGASNKGMYMVLVAMVANGAVLDVPAWKAIDILDEQDMTSTEVTTALSDAMGAANSAVSFLHGKYGIYAIRPRGCTSGKCPLWEVEARSAKYIYFPNLLAYFEYIGQAFIQLLP